MGIFSRLFGRGRPESEAPARLTNAEVGTIIGAYGAVLARGEVGAGIIADTTRLPYPKSTIKAALQVALRLTLDAQMKEQLKIGYISLADWQDGVGGKPLGVNLQNLDLSTDPLVLAQALATPDPKATAYQKKADAEAQVLQNELKSLGLW